MATEPYVGASPGGVLRMSRPEALPLPARHQRLQHTLLATFRAAEWVFCTGALFLFASALLPLLLRESGSSFGMAEGNPELRKVFYATYAGMLGFAGIQWKRWLRAAFVNRWLPAVVLLAAASFSWSAEPDVTLRRSIALAMTTGFGWYLAARYSPLGLVRLLACALGLALLLSAAFGLVLPEYGISRAPNAGDWQGVFLAKNVLGKIAALGGVVFLLLWTADRRRMMSAGGFGLAVALLLLSRSKTSLVIFCTMVALFPLLGVLRWRLTRGIPVMATALLLAGSVGVLLAAHAEKALGILGRDLTLTGRTGLWAAIAQVGMARPWLGSGFSAFWVEGNSELSLVHETAGWTAGGAHNGFLDLWLELGFTGVLAMIVVLLIVLKRSLSNHRSLQRPETAWPLLFLAFFMLSNLTESSLLRQNTLLWVLFAATAASTDRRRWVAWTAIDSLSQLHGETRASSTAALRASSFRGTRPVPSNATEPAAAGATADLAASVDHGRVRGGAGTWQRRSSTQYE